MPPKPPDMMKGAGAEYYNIDFSLNHQLRLAGAAPAAIPAEESPSKKNRFLKDSFELYVDK